MAKFNNSLVLILSYFPFLFTNLVPDPEARYQAGWIFVALTAFLVVTNLVVVVKSTIVDTIEEARRRAVEQHNYRLLMIRRIEMDIIVVSPLQKFRKYIGVDWLFAENSDKRLNELIAQYLPEYEYSNSKFLIGNASIFAKEVDF